MPPTLLTQLIELKQVVPKLTTDELIRLRSQCVTAPPVMLVVVLCAKLRLRAAGKTLSEIEDHCVTLVFVDEHFVCGNFHEGLLEP